MARILNLSFRAMEKPNAVPLFRKRMLLEGYPEKSTENLMGVPLYVVVFPSLLLLF